MYCKNCGQQIDDKAVVCIHCGCSVVEQKPAGNPEHSESKIGWGVLAALFLGLIGLIIGICVFPADTVARKTFVKGWGITFGITVGVYVILYAIIIGAGLAMM